MKLARHLPLLIALLPALSASASIRQDKIRVAELKKTEAYVYDGLIVGGDKAISDVVVKDIRRAENGAFERVVLDIVGTRQGEAPAIQRPPYYQIAVSPDEKRLVFTVFGRPRLEFDATKVKAAFKKSRMVSNVLLYPRLDDDSWTFAFELKNGRAVEAFELSNPVRIIVDIRDSELTQTH